MDVDKVYVVALFLDSAVAGCRATVMFRNDLSRYLFDNVMAALLTNLTVHGRPLKCV